MGKHRHGKKKKEVSRLIVSVTNMQTKLKKESNDENN